MQYIDKVINDIAGIDRATNEKVTMITYISSITFKQTLANALNYNWRVMK